jgi:hypothetical protein
VKRLILASLLLTAPAALADDAKPAPGLRALELMLSREIAAHQNDLGAAIQLQDQVADLTKQLADLKAKPEEKPDAPKGK